MLEMSKTHLYHVEFEVHTYVTGLCVGVSNGSGDHCVYALARQSLGN